ncbi:unannotated protein [freshwater metagenome]|jgi:hypothetical protein|uniref:Unannotated protein n=1 Tax=freshwater metagenome TaxID=449393 RepID=A0A6J6APN6_9ZZZZ|nr:hypothetical protein [Actinomycetota bacterium]MSY25222.1 hypothetical protein [Actinomycetota bacterium]MTB23414.1 hypothetical protein [Actinomycetota bacterium]
MIRFLAVVLGGLIAATLGFVVAARRRQPEPTWEPGLEFNPDFDLTAEEILADIRGEAPTA